MSDTVTERLLLDCWPVEVWAPHLERAPFLARAWVTNQRLLVVTADVAAPLPGYGTPYYAVKAAYTASTPAVVANRGTFHGQLHFVTEAGPVDVTRSAGCGCHHPVKAMSPPVPW